jgi:chromate transporter
MQYIKLFFIFFKFGTFTFGGGYAMIGFIERYFVTEKKLMTQSLMSDFVALAQVVPGMIALNLSHLVGRHLHKRLGGFIAVLGVSLPSIIIISILAYGFQFIYEIPIVLSILKGILAGVMIVFIHAIISLSKALKDHVYMYVYSILVFISIVSGIPMIIIISLSVVLGIIHHLWIVKKVSHA